MSSSPLDPARTDLIEKIDHSRYVRSSRSRRRTLMIIGLAAALSIVSLVLVVVAIYSVVKIDSQNEYIRKLDHSLAEVRKEVNVLKPELERRNKELAAMMQNRFPNLIELKMDEMMNVGADHIKSVFFTSIRQGKRQYYKYLLVAENNTTEKIQPGYRILLFDEHGVHVATDEVHDTNVIAPGENRDYTAEIEFFFDAEPRHFYVEDLTATSLFRG